MALPKPKNKEKKSDFVSRCVSEVAKDPKFKDNKQRVAICYTQFDESKKSDAAIIGGEGEDEFLIFAQEVDLNAPEMEEETPEQELTEMKKDLYDMAVASLSSIKAHTDMILNSLQDLSVQDNLTETWIQSKVAIAEDYLVKIHNYVIFNKED